VEGHVAGGTALDGHTHNYLRITASSIWARLNLSIRALRCLLSHYALVTVRRQLASSAAGLPRVRRAKAGFSIADVQQAGIDLLQRIEDMMVAGVIVSTSWSGVYDGSIWPDWACAAPSMPKWAATASAAAPMERDSSSHACLSRIEDGRRIARLRGRWALHQPKVNAKASTPASRNAISNCRSAICPGWRIW
jgi:hypothetical protein